MNRKYILIVLTVVLFASCEKILIGPDAENTPAGNFDVLWKTLDEKYGLFPVTDVNWDSLYTVYSAQLDETSTEAELWAVCCSVLAPLANGHITLFDKDYMNWYNPDNPSADLYNAFSIDVVKSGYLEHPTITGDGKITYGLIRNSPLGYIYIQDFLGVASGRDWIRDMDHVISELYECEGIILDVRNNPGGFTRNDLYAASFFVDREITYYYSSLKTGPGHYDFSDAEPKVINPRADTLKYLKKTAVLTSRFTASGGEAFTIICNELPNSAHIGDITIGAIGEVSHVAQLPNGWTLNYPCTLTTFEDGSSPEGRGIAPEIHITGTVADVNAGIDRVLERATAHLMQLP
jgi:hypothetical protein